MNETGKRVVIIDDDNCNNKILKIILRNLCKPFVPQVTDFTLPAEGIAYLTNFLLSDSKPIILFLDINMPLLTGWDVLDRLRLLPTFAREKLTVYMLSSSIDFVDEQRAEANVLVTKYVRKPLTTGMRWIKEAIIETVAV